MKFKDLVLCKSKRTFSDMQIKYFKFLFGMIMISFHYAIFYIFLMKYKLYTLGRIFNIWVHVFYIHQIRK